MFVEQLDVVNACLATMGEAPLNTLEDDHSYKAAALQRLTRTTLDIQKKSYWFNTEFLELVPEADSKYIYIPQDVIEIRAPQYRGLSVAQRGKRLYNTGANSYQFEQSLCVQVVRALSFADLPYHAAAAVRDRAVLLFQQDYDGDVTKYRELQSGALLSMAELNAEEVRQRKPNLLQSNRTLRRIMQWSEGHSSEYAEVPHPLMTN